MSTFLLLLQIAAATPDSGAWTPGGIWYRVTGRGAPVVLVHGSNLDSRTFYRVRDVLATTTQVVEVDLRFHGRSRDGTGSYSFERDVLEVIDQVGVERPVLVGHSLGATVAIDLALAMPARLAGLVLLAPSISGMPATRQPEGLAGLGAAVRSGNMDEAGRILAAAPVMSLMRDTTDAAFLRGIVRQNVRLFTSDRTRYQSMGEPAVTRLSELQLPVLIVTGGADRTEAGLAAARLLSDVKGSTAHDLSGCGHILPLDCAHATTAAIRSFLRGSQLR